MPSAVDSIKAAVARLEMDPEQEAVVAQWVIEGDTSRRPWRRHRQALDASIPPLPGGHSTADVLLDRREHRRRHGAGAPGLWPDGVDVRPAMTVGAAIGALQIRRGQAPLRHRRRGPSASTTQAVIAA